MDLFEQLMQIFRDVFGDENLSIKREMTADDIEDWDSLMHINIIAACESTFKIKFAIQELVAFRNVGDIADAIEGKLK